MFNHRTPKNTKWTYDENRKGFVVESVENILEGETIYYSYGIKCNSSFFNSYGFINQPNGDSNTVILVPSILKDEKAPGVYDAKLQLISGTKPDKEFRVSYNLNTKLMLNFFSWLRFCEFNGDLDSLKNKSESGETETFKGFVDPIDI